MSGRRRRDEALHVDSPSRPGHPPYRWALDPVSWLDRPSWVTVGKAHVDPPRIAHPGFVSGRSTLTEAILLDHPPQFLLVRLELRIQGVDLRPDRGAALDHPPLPLLSLVLALASPGSVADHLGLPGRPNQNPVRSEVDIDQLDPLVRQAELAHLVRVGHAARLQDVEPAVPLAVGLELAHQEPGVDQRRDLSLRGLEAREGRARQARHQGGDLAALEEVDHPG